MTASNACRRALRAALGLLVLAMAPVVAATPVRDPGVLADGTALRAFAATERARPRAEVRPRRDFLARPLLLQARLSPDGTQVAALVDDGRQRSLWLATPAQPAGRVRVATSGAEQIAFSRDGAWLFLVEPTRILALPMHGTGGTQAVATLGGRTHRTFAGVDPWQPAAVLLREAPPMDAPAPRVFRLWRAGPGAAPVVLHAGLREIVDFAFAPEGRLSHLLLASGESHVVLHRDASQPWRALAVCARMQRCSFIGTSAADGSLLLRSDLGLDRLALQRMDHTGNLTVLHADPHGVADLADVALDPRDNAPRVAAYRSTVVRNHGLDPAAARIVAALARTFPGRNLDLEPGATHWLVHERGDDLQTPRLHLLDPDIGGPGVELIAALGTQYQGRPAQPLPEAGLARQRAVSWTASDGLPMHGFVMLPPGVDAARAPLLTLVHGGPFNHVQPIYNTQAQFLANRGFVVFLPNFRSSTGHGRRFVLAANGEFSGDGPVQRDIVEGTRWLLANGVGDASRVGIVGASFGGFSALNGVTFQPDLFRVGIAAVPPSDFGFVIREYLGAGKPMQPGIPIAASMRHLGLDPAARALMARLAAGSPQAHAARMSRPLLVLAGGEDDRVPIRGVTHYAATLQQLGKDVSLFVDAEAGHGLANPRTREAYLYLQEALLHRTLGGPAPAPPDKALAAHVARNLRLAGASLAELAPRARKGAAAHADR